MGGGGDQTGQLSQSSSSSVPDAHASTSACPPCPVWAHWIRKNQLIAPPFANYSCRIGPVHPGSCPHMHSVLMGWLRFALPLPSGSTQTGSAVEWNVTSATSLLQLTVELSTLTLYQPFHDCWNSRCHAEPFQVKGDATALSLALIQPSSTVILHYTSEGNNQPKKETIAALSKKNDWQ